MLLETLEVSNFRNLNGKFEFSERLNIVAGDNGLGKTNCLEAIGILSTTKSFKTSRLAETIRFGEDMAILRGRVLRGEDIRHDLQVVLNESSKTPSVNGKKEAATRYINELHTVVFSSEQLSIVRGAPDERRRFLDEGVVQIFPPFIKTLSDFSKVIKQRNSLLQSASEVGMAIDAVQDALAPWNEQLVALSTKIHRARVRYVERLNTVLQRKLFGREEVSIRYASSLEDKGDLSDYPGLLAERLSIRVQAELAAGRSLIGPHRDDLEIGFDGHDIRKFGSSGQQRSALLLLQLASLAVYNEQNAEYPLFLIDDIDAELDYRRIGQLLEFLTGKTQTFVTTSKESFVDRFGAGSSIFAVSDGIPRSMN
jgi:DNA replication and repair protein RecF